MSVTPSSAIVGVFTDRANAEQALDAMYNAGITHEQIRYSGSETSGSFLDDLKGWFTGQNAGGNVANDLTDLGLSNDEANYYANEHSKGNAIVAVRAPGREADVQSILQQHGSLNAQPQIGPAENSLDNQPIQQPVTTSYNDEVQHMEPSNTPYNDSAQQDTSSVATENTPPITHDNVTEPTHTDSVSNDQEAHPVVLDGSLPQDTSAANTSSDTHTTGDYDTNTSPSYTEQQPQSSSQDVQPTTSEYVATNSYTPPDSQLTTTGHEATDPHATSDAMIESETESRVTNEGAQAASESYTQASEDAGIPDIQTAQPAATIADYSSEHQVSDDQAMASRVPTQPLTKSSTATDASTTTTSDAQPLATGVSTTTSDVQPLATGGSTTTSDAQPLATGGSNTTTNDTDEVQSLQSQIASLQQQLQAAKAQLQAAKDREEQTRAAREREQQLQSLRQQLQALQAELSATNSEIQETQTRIAGY